MGLGGVTVDKTGGSGLGGLNPALWETYDESNDGSDEEIAYPAGATSFLGLIPSEGIQEFPLLLWGGSGIGLIGGLQVMDKNINFASPSFAQIALNAGGNYSYRKTSEGVVAYVDTNEIGIGISAIGANLTSTNAPGSANGGDVCPCYNAASTPRLGFAYVRSHTSSPRLVVGYGYPTGAISINTQHELTLVSSTAVGRSLIQRRTPSKQIVVYEDSSDNINAYLTSYNGSAFTNEAGATQLVAATAELVDMHRISDTQFLIVYTKSSKTYALIAETNNATPAVSVGTALEIYGSGALNPHGEVAVCSISNGYAAIITKQGSSVVLDIVLASGSTLTSKNTVTLTGVNGASGVCCLPNNRLLLAHDDSGTIVNARVLSPY